MKIVLSIGSYVAGQFSFDNFGSQKHLRAVDKSMQRFLSLMGEDLIDEFPKYVKVR